jgi:hypothetical protein
MKTPCVLFIAPNAPPKNTAEAIQVRRILSDLDRKARGTLVTVVTDDAGWSRRDDTLNISLQNFDTQILALPLHRFTHRVLASHRLKQFLLPDSHQWIRWMAGSIRRNLHQQPDVIYSRSSPMSAALLASQLKKTLGVPWIMHLSDPWADNPYATPHPRHHRAEAACFTDADRITLTTQTQATHYQQKYPAHAHKISVSPNVMPEIRTGSTVDTSAAFRLVFAGSFYGERSPKPLVEALKLLPPELLKNLRIDVYGNAQDDARNLLISMRQVIHYHGAVSFAEAQEAQEAADIVLSMEPEINHPLGSSFLPSKVLDCLALGKPLLAITPDDSETASICREGYGWAVPPSRPDLLAELLTTHIKTLPTLRLTPAKIPPQRYAIQTIVDDLIMQIHRLIKEPSA